MIALQEPLDTIDFDALFDIARSKLPTLAPEWTDYNYSDPGITLVDLLAWIADSQIYALARDRRDERIAMAALLGLTSIGAVPAIGTLLPTGIVTAGPLVAAGAVLKPAGVCAPRLEVQHPVPMTGVAIKTVLSEGPAGVIDHSESNRQARATFAPFGIPPSADTRLVVILSDERDRRKGEVSLGFELDGDDAGDGDELGEIRIAYRLSDDSEVPVPIRFDSTNNLRRSGAIIVSLPDAPTPLTKEHRFVIRQTQAALLPRLRRIVPDALPVSQRATLQPDPFLATGRPGQVLTVMPTAWFRSDEAAAGYPWRLAAADPGLAMSVEVEENGVFRPWRAGDLDQASGECRLYQLDERPDGSGIAIRFGNGVNGHRPATGAQIRATPVVSAGRLGNVAAGIDWVLEGEGTRWTNHEAIDGGRDADDLGDLLRRLRATLRDRRPLVTSAQIAAAARSLPRAFGVARASVVDGWEPGRRRPAWPATRTLLVTRSTDSVDGAVAAETADWLRAIARRLRPQMPLAERLVVDTPRWRRLRIAIVAVAAARRVPAEIAEEIGLSLAARLTRGGSPGDDWPLGLDVTAMAVGGWIRQLPGVAALHTVTLLDADGRPLPGNILRLGRGDLPLFVPQDGDVQVSGGAA